MIILPADVEEQRLRGNIERVIGYLAASIDADCNWSVEVPVTDLTISRLQAAINRVIEAVEKTRRERDEIAGRLVTIATFDRNDDTALGPPMLDVAEKR